MAEAPPIGQWPMPDVSEAEESLRSSFLRRKCAVEMWLDGKDETEIRKICRMSARQARLLTERCVAVNPMTQQIFGYWVCHPKFRVPTLKRERYRAFDPEQTRYGRGLSGVLCDLFRRYPNIKKGMTDFVVSRKIRADMQVNAITAKKIHEVFISLCRREEVPRTDWPFNVKQAGYKAINSWYRKKRFEKPVTSANNEFGQAEADMLSSDYQRQVWNRSRGHGLAFARVELDEHKFDAAFEIGYPIGGQHIETILASRLWALACVEAESRAVLSSGLAYGMRYTKNDVLRVIRRAIMPPERYRLSFKDAEFCYADDAAYPMELPEFYRNSWQVLAMDSDSTHSALLRTDSLKDSIGCDVVFDRVGKAQSRPYIEKFFGTFAEAASWLPSATGNRPGSPYRRNDPAAQAIKYHLYAHLAEELLDVTCRNYNVSSQAGTGGVSPLLRLKELLQRGQVFRLPTGELSEERLWMLLPCYPAKLNRRSVKSRSGPLYVELHGARYTGKALSNAPELAHLPNRNVRIYVEEDARLAYVVHEDFPLRTYKVAVSGKYDDEPHTLMLRRAHHTFCKNRKMSDRVTQPLSMLGFARGLAEAGKGDSAAATVLGEAISFMTHYNRGEVPLVGLQPDEAQQLLDTVHDIDLWADGEDGEEGSHRRPDDSESDDDDVSGGIVFIK